MQFDLKGHNCFWVYQNRTFHEEAAGGFLWSPKFAKFGKTNPGYEAMKEVRKGDVIFHSYEGKIVAVGRAKGCCYSAPNPGKSFDDWGPDGWKIDVEYFLLSIPFGTYAHREEIYKIQPKNGPIRSDGVGKQQYLCNLNQAVFDYVMRRILASLPTSEGEELLKFIGGERIPPVPLPIEVLSEIEDCCWVEAFLFDGSLKQKVTLEINITQRPNQAKWLGKKVGDVLEISTSSISYRVEKIYRK